MAKMSRQTKKKESENYLDFIMVHHEQYAFLTDEEGAVTIFVQNRGIFNKIAQMLFRKPKVSQIHLDKMGNFIWPLLDGEHTVYQIAEQVKLAFGKEAEPLYDRLVKYLQTLESYGFIKRK